MEKYISVYIKENAHNNNKKNDACALIFNGFSLIHSYSLDISSLNDTFIE